MWIKHYLGWMWLGIKLTFELSGGTEKMFFTSSTPADSTVVSFQVISRSWNLLYWPPQLSQQNTRARCSWYKYCVLNESPSGCHSVFKPVPARCLCASSSAYWMSDLKTCPALFLLWMRWNGDTDIIACVAKDNEHVTTSHVAFILHWDFQKGQSRWKVFV